MEGKYKLIIDSFGRDRFKFNEPLKEYTLLQIGGPAKLLFMAFKTQELIRLIKMCRQLKLPFFIIGSGSKSMISDSGFDGLVIKNITKNIQIVSIKGKVSKFGVGIEEALVEVDSGLSMAKFVEFLEGQKLTTTEFKGIPGTVGGNLFLLKALQSRAKSIKVLTLTDQIEEIEADELKFNRHVVISAIFRVKAKD